MKFLKKLNMNSGYTPKGTIPWMTKLSSEFLGTIFLAWMIGILGVTFNGIKLEVIISGGYERGASRLVIGFWVSLDVLIVLAIFARWSCDLNPAVTTYRIIDHQNSLKYGLSKIGVQLFGGIIGGLFIWTTQETSHLISHHPGDITIRNIQDAKNAWIAMPDKQKTINQIIQKYSFISNKQDIILHWNALAELPDFTIVKEFRELQPWSAFTTGMDIAKIKHNFGWDLSIGMIGEFLGVFILLFPIMTKEIKSPILKDIVLLLIVGFGVAALLELGTVAWNPARLLATNWIYDFLKPGTHGMTIYPMYALGEIMAPFALFYGQKIVYKVNKLWEKWLELGKVYDLSQHINEKKLDNLNYKMQKRIFKRIYQKRKNQKF